MGGKREAFERAAPALNAIGNDIEHAGNVGVGQAALPDGLS